MEFYKYGYLIMSVMLGTKKIAGLGLNGTSFPLLGHFWSDHIVNDISFLKADTFSWHSGEIYTAVYNHLINDLVDATTQTDVISGISIEYKLAKDGHKIVLDDDTDINHLRVKELHESFGASWYYVLTTTNKAFKLPRTKYGFTGIDNNPVGTSIDNTAAGSGIKSTQMYLYFFVGNYSRSAIEQTAGYAQELTELKANKNLDNLDEAGQAILNAKANVSLSNLDTNGRAILNSKASISLDNLNAMGQAILDSKANVSNTVTTDSDQKITCSKKFYQPAAGMSIDMMAETNQQTVPATPTIRRLGLYANTEHTKGDGYTSWIQGYRGSDGFTVSSLYTRKFLENDANEILSHIDVGVSPEGITYASAPTPDVSWTGDNIATCKYVNTKFQVVSTEPASPDPNVFYFIPE